MYQDGLTIAIPTWNHEVFLPRAVRSALEAARMVRTAGTQAEVMVVDDASRDGTHSLLRQLEARYHKDGLRVRIHPSNLRVGSARNTALREASYRYILFLDADNEIIGANVSLFLQAIRDTSAAVVYGSLLVRKLGSPRVCDLTSHGSFQNRVFDDNYIDALALVDRPQIIDVGGASSEWLNWEDWELWAHLACNGRRIVFMPVALGYYHIVPGSKLQGMKNQQEMDGRLKRTFNQTGFRHYLRTRTNQLRYHPALGYL